MKSSVVRAFGLFASVLLNSYATSTPPSWVDVQASITFSVSHDCPPNGRSYSDWQTTSPVSFSDNGGGTAGYDLSDHRALVYSGSTCLDGIGLFDSGIVGFFEMTLESTEVLWIDATGEPEGGCSVQVESLSTGLLITSERVFSSGGPTCFPDAPPLLPARLKEGLRLPAGRYRVQFGGSGSGYAMTCGTGLSSYAAFTLSLSDCPTDLDHDGRVAMADLSLMLLQFGPCPYCPADLDESGAVETSDIALLLLDFGSCPVEP